MTLDDPQSETAIAVSSTLDFAPSVVVTFNDDTDEEANGHIEYTAATRTIYPGASLMGWSYSLDSGQSFTYGGKVAPPLEQGWWALWGDPAITTQTGAPENSNVFMGSLAISFGLLQRAEVSCTTRCWARWMVPASRDRSTEA